MLHYETVEPDTLSVLNNLLELPDLQDFALVGGTALSLLYGHRISFDLNLFSSKPFDNEVLVRALQSQFGASLDVRSTNPRFGIFCFVDDVKIDIIRYQHPQIRPQLTIEDIRMFSTEDIIAMKVQAILGRGKKKDFWDVAELLKHYTIADFIALHKEKFVTQNLLISVPQAITYFSDADESEDPISLQNQTWASVKTFISEKVSEYLA
jgi:Nucleotidyl transferase AbiEii toxin, Type IV TA system